MIDNWVKSDFQDEPMQVTRVCENLVTMGIHVEMYEHLQPIKLTAEILVKSGFKKTHIDRDNAYVLNGFMVQYNTLLGCYSFRVAGNHAPLALYYVHDLQNLYQVHKQKSLEITL